MTEISEAAKRKACELASQQTGDFWNMRDAEFSDTLINLIARILQEHSDVAKAIARHGYSDPPTSVDLRERLQSLILPDEPCAHESVFRYPPTKTFTCTKCGKALKIVESGDE